MDWDALNQSIVNCRLCPRLVTYREEVARTKRRAYRDWDYWGRPVTGFGDAQATSFTRHYSGPVLRTSPRPKIAKMGCN